MTPSEELRAAAARLREMAKATSGGTWTAEHLERHGVWWVNHETADDEGWTTWGTVAECTSVDMGSNAAWIALMGPDKAEAVALLLEGEALAVESCNDWSEIDATFLPIRDLARAINGGAE